MDTAHIANRPAHRLAATLLLAALGCGAGTAAETLRLEAIRDTSIVLLDGEEREHHGAFPRIRIKGNQHLVAMGFDTAALRGREVASAVLVCRQDERDLRGVSISTIQAEWDEQRANGVSAGLEGIAGWGVPGQWFPAVCGGNAGSLCATIEAKAEAGVYRWPVPADLVQALATGTAFGLAIQEVDADYSRNPTIFAHEQSQHRPFLEVVLRDGEAPLPDAPRGLALAGVDPEALLLTLRAPRHAFAYRVTVGERELPRWNIPFARPGEQQTILLRDLPLAPGSDLLVSVVAIDRRGRASPPATVRGRVPAPAAIAIPEVAATVAAGEPPAGLAVIPTLDKYDASGAPVGELPADHRRRNEVFDGTAIRLVAAAGEVVSFQVLANGSGRVTVGAEVPGCRVDRHRAVYVTTPRGRIPDPLLAIDSVDLRADEATPIIVEVFVPFTATAGERRGRFTLSDGRELPIVLRVRDFALPRRAGFSIELNGYGLPDTSAGFYRLQQVAYDHRAHCNLVPYGHRSTAPGARRSNMAMMLPSGRRMDEQRYNAFEPGATQGWWDDFITAFGPYLSGTCFADGHRGTVPAPAFYLTFHESWPLAVRPFFNGDADAVRAFAARPEYAQTYVAVLADFIAMAERQGWKETGFQVFLNNKGKLDDPNRAPWILDEPASWWDYRALDFYAQLTERAKGRDCPIDLDYRIDISRPEFTRGSLAGNADLWVVPSGTFGRYHRLVADRARAEGFRITTYGETNAVEASNRAAAAWCLSAFRDGAEGVVPWQTVVGGEGPYQAGDALALLIPHEVDGQPVVDRSLRLDAFLRAQQDIEYLILLRDRLGLTPGQLRRFIDHHLDLASSNEKRYAEDAGRDHFRRLDPDAFRRLREAAAQLITKHGTGH